MGMNSEPENSSKLQMMNTSININRNTNKARLHFLVDFQRGDSLASFQVQLKGALTNTLYVCFRSQDTR